MTSKTPDLPTPLPAPDAIDRIAKLGEGAAAVTFTEVTVPTTFSEDPGLPVSIPVGIRHGQRPELIGLRDEFERWRLRPQRRRGTAKALTLDAFILLVNRHKDGDSVVFADTDWRAPRFTAVLDYHEADGDPRNLTHRVTYEFPRSEPWKTWTAANGEKMGQAAFASFIEDNIADLSSPTDTERTDLEARFMTKIATPAELVRLSRGLQVHVEAKVANAVTLQNGEGRILFEETHKGADGEAISVPGLFILSVPPFFGGDPVRVPVRLRYRAASGSLVWFFEMWRPDLLITERVSLDLDAVREATGLPAYEGHPEA